LRKQCPQEQLSCAHDLPQFIETPDFLHFKFITLNGPAVQNKGMALFPRKVNRHYAMLGRQDYENIYVMFSDDLHFWVIPYAMSDYASTFATASLDEVLEAMK
jgi:predicted GH43/DUF377 family glycosyl hydrolase